MLNIFSGCTSLTSISIPQSVTKIGSSAFSETGISELDIPENVTEIGSGIVSECDNLESIRVAAGNESYDSRNGCNAIIETATGILVAGCKNSSVPEGITAIGEQAFMNHKDLQSVVLPTGVKTIGEEAFTGCSKLRTISIPETVGSIGRNAFQGCSNLESFRIPEGIKVIASECFENCEKLSEVVIPQSTEKIEWAAFKNCASLLSVVIPSSVTTIGASAFLGCSALTDVTSEAEEPVDIVNSVFSDINPDATLYVPSGSTAKYKSSTGWDSFKYMKVIDGQWATGDVLIAPTAEGIPMTFVVTDAENKTVQVGDDESAAIDVDTTGKVTIPEQIEGMTVTSVASMAFRSCSIDTINISSSVGTIGNKAFNQCSQLTEIVIPEGVERIEELTFANCPKLKVITLPSTLSFIEIDAFSECPSISNITSYIANPFVIDEWTFASEKTENGDVVPDLSVYKNAKLHVPTGKVGTYRSTEGWNLFSAIKETRETFDVDGIVYYIESNPLTEGKQATAWVYGVTDNYADYQEDSNDFVIPGEITTADGTTYTVEGISVSALKNVQLHYVYLSEGIVAIGDDAFGNQFSRLYLPSSLKSIGARAFADNTNLSRIYCYGMEPCSVDETSFSSDNFSGKLFVPLAAKDAYQQADVWKSFERLTEFAVVDSVWYYAGEADHEVVIHSCMDKKQGDLVIPSSIQDAYGQDYLVTGTEEGAFANLAITSLVLPSTIKTIGNFAFSNCSSLQSITFLGSISSIYYYCFTGCDNLRSLYSYAETPNALDANVFDNVASTVTLYVPYGTKTVYEATEGWNKFTNIVEMELPDTDIAAYDNILYVSNTECTADGRNRLVVKMRNSTAARGYSVDIYLPDGFTFAQNDGDMAQQSTARTAGLLAEYFESSLQPDGALRVSASFMTENTFSGNDGEVALITIEVPKDAEPGDYAIILKEMLIGIPGSAKGIPIDGVCKSTLTVQSYPRGDANHSHKVDFLDFIAVVNYKLGMKDDPDFNEVAADVNGNGVIDIGDLTALANFWSYGTFTRTIDASARRSARTLDPQ